MSNLLEKAKQVAAKAHAGQVDKAGQPYINHPLAVADSVNGEAEKIVALLHDVVEDSPITLDEIRQMGFGEDVVAALGCITKRKGEDYEAYLARVGSNSLARSVKLADLSHNMDLSRLQTVTEKDTQRQKKYEYAFSFLSERSIR